MFLLVDDKVTSQKNMETQLQSLGPVSTFTSWRDCRAFLESAAGSSFQYGLISESIFKSFSDPMEELSAVGPFFSGLWAILSAQPQNLFDSKPPGATLVEFWTPESVLSKVEFLSRHLSEWGPASAPKSVDGFVVRDDLCLTDIGLMTEGEPLPGAVSFSPEGHSKQEVLWPLEVPEFVGGKRHQWFGYTTSGGLRHLYRRLQKDLSRKRLPAPAGPQDQGVPALAWVAAGEDDKSSLLEFFPELPVLNLPSLGTESQDQGIAGEGSKDFFHDSKPGQIASFKVNTTDHKVLGLWGSDLSGYQEFLGWPMEAIMGRSALEMISQGEQQRFLEMIRRLPEIRPLINFFEMSDFKGNLHFAEVLVDLHRDGEEEFLLVRVNPWPGELEDHMLKGHEEGLRPSDWPRWVILPKEEWQRVGKTEGVRSRVQNFFRKPQGAPEVSVWLTTASALKLEEVSDLMSQGVDRVWPAPYPYRLMARQIHRQLGEPFGDSGSLEIQWSSEPQSVFLKVPLRLEEFHPGGSIVQAGSPLIKGQSLVLSGPQMDGAFKGFVWARVVDCQPFEAGCRAQLSFVVVA